MALEQLPKSAQCWSMNGRKLGYGFGKSPDAGSRNAQTSNLTKSGAAISVVLPGGWPSPHRHDIFTSIG